MESQQPLAHWRALQFWTAFFGFSCTAAIPGIVVGAGHGTNAAVIRVAAKLSRTVSNRERPRRVRYRPEGRPGSALRSSFHTVFGGRAGASLLMPKPAAAEWRSSPTGRWRAGSTAPAQAIATHAGAAHHTAARPRNR